MSKTAQRKLQKT